MSVTLYLLNKKGLEVLTALLHSKKYRHSIDLVVGAKEHVKNKNYYDDIRQLCSRHGILYKERGEALFIQSKFSIAIGWRWLIKDCKNLIVLHDSLLPKYRGFSPVVNMLINGEPYLGATAIWASEIMDQGDIIYQEKTNIYYPIKIEKAIELVSVLYVKIVSNLFQIILENNVLDSYSQDNTQASYSIWRNEQDYYINWDEDAARIVRFVDAVGYPYDGAKSTTDYGDTIKIIDCELVDKIVAEIYAPGKLLMYDKGYPIILCGKNAVKLLNIEDMKGKPYNFRKFRTRLV